MEAILFPVPKRDPNSWQFELALARDFAIMTLFWSLVQVCVFLLPLRRSFGCDKSSTWNVKQLPAHYTDSCNRLVSILHATFCIISTNYYFFSGWGESFPPECGKSTAELEYFIVMFSSAYHLYDILALMYLGIID